VPALLKQDRATLSLMLPLWKLKESTRSAHDFYALWPESANVSVIVE